jgi:hypothetical protein
MDQNVLHPLEASFEVTAPSMGIEEAQCINADHRIKPGPLRVKIGLRTQYKSTLTFAKKESSNLDNAILVHIL